MPKKVDPALRDRAVRLVCVSTGPSTPRRRRPRWCRLQPVLWPRLISRGRHPGRLSTSVDEGLLQAARRVRSGNTDAAMIDEALRAMVARHRLAEVESSYTAYDKHPLDEPAEWGDLASFREAAARCPRSEVWWCETAEIGRRPVVVLSRDADSPARVRTRRTVHHLDPRPRQRSRARARRGHGPPPLRGQYGLGREHLSRGPR
jgi:hypothetical protein